MWIQVWWPFLVLVLLAVPMGVFAQEGLGQGQEVTLPGVEKSPFRGSAPGEKKDIEISLDNMDIYPVLDYVLGTILELNYVVDPGIKGTISVKIKGRYSKQEFLDLFNSILQIHGVAINKGGHGLYKVTKKGESGKVGTIQVSTAGKRKAGPGDVISVYQLRYISAAHAAASLRNFVSPGALVLPEPGTNALIVVDTADNLKKLGKILSLMDTSLFKDVQWRLFSLEYTDAEDMSRDLNKIFLSEGLYMRPGMEKGGLQIIPLKTVNSILVVTRWPELLDITATWIKELDQGHSGKGARVYVYFVQNGQAKDLADLLNQIYSEGKGAGRAGGGGSKKVLVKRTAEKKRAMEAASGELAGKVEIIADETNNALLIKASPRDYATIKEVLDKIDVVPRQVLIDVLIVDVALTNDVRYGVEWYLKNHFKGSYYGNLALGTGVTLAGSTSNSALPPPIGAGAAGIAYTLYATPGDLRGLLMSLAEKTDVKILSSPNILAVDNQESSIEVVNNVPTLGPTHITGDTITRSIEYRNAGIILKVKPSINDSGLVRMEVTQEVSSVVSEKTEGIESPRFKTRKASTHIVATDGQTILIGGLMQTQRTKGSSGVPILKNIPILGYVFGGWHKSLEKTELLIAITPHVIKSKEEADALMKEFSERVKSIQKVLKEHPVTRGGTRP